MTDTLILIPCYNGSQTIVALVQQIKQTYPNQAILVIDDGSQDDTHIICQSHQIPFIRQDLNQGKGAAIYLGMQYAQMHNYSWVITMDADGQHAPHFIALFLEEIQKRNASIIIGKRNFDFKKMPFFRSLSNRITTAMMSWLCSQDVYDSQCGYRAYSLELFSKNLIPQTGRFQWESEVIFLASQNQYRISSIPISTLYFDDHSSHINHVQDTIRFLKLYRKMWRLRV